ncbi:diguanylate cyclase [Rhodoferax sp. WC2427]|uniref:diguanylate cyclase domain-containing protein n=1 Tax=Rhodoferax sp. WC2427 TaxID=3234144 RepID=UPI003465AC4E
MCLWSSAARAAEVPTVVLTSAATGVSLVGRTGVLVDTQGDMDIASVRTTAVDALFAVPGKLIQQAGLDGHARWFKFQLRQTGEEGAWLIDSNQSAAREIQVFGPFDAQGRALAAPVDIGFLSASAMSSLGGNRAVYRFSLEQPGDYTVYLRVASYFPEYFAFTVWDAAVFGQAEQGWSLFHGICYGFLLAMVATNLVLLLVFRDAMYSHNFLASMFALLTLTAINGHLARYLLPGARSWVPYILSAAIPLWVTFAGLFSLRFLALEEHARRLDQWTRRVLVLGPVAAVLALMGWFPLSLLLTQAIGLFVPCLMWWGGFVVLRRGGPPARWYFAGLTLLDLSAVGTVLNIYGVLKLSFPYLLLQLGAVVETLVFAIAIGSRILRIHRLNGELGLRTQQLSAAAHTDALTGIYNRAGWTQHAPQLIAHAGSSALLLIDLDHFKPVNDQFGHAAGDAVLCSVAKRLGTEVRGRGIVARLGGDEFVVLLSGRLDRKQLVLQAQNLILLISQPVPYQGQLLNVGASVGIARYPKDGAALPELMNAADRAMYYVKERGRAGFAFMEDVKAAASMPAGLESATG